MCWLPQDFIEHHRPERFFEWSYLAPGAEAVADPFRRTRDLLALLDLRASQERAA